MFIGTAIIGCASSTEVEPLPESASEDHSSEADSLCERYCEARSRCYPAEVWESCTAECGDDCSDICDEECILLCEQERDSATRPNDCILAYDAFLDCGSQLEDPCSGNDADQEIITACNPEYVQFYACWLSDDPT